MEIQLTGKTSEGADATINVDPSTLDFKALGGLDNDSVTALKLEAEKRGFEKRQAEIDQSNSQLAEAQNQLETFKTNLSQKDRAKGEAEDRLQRMEETINRLNTNLGEQQKAREQAELKSSILGSVADVDFLEGGQSIFQSHVMSKRQTDGSYVLTDGTSGPLDQVKSEWLETPIGKALTKAKQNGGAGSAPTDIAGISFAEVVNNPELKDQWIDKHGMEEYSKEYSKMNLAKVQGQVADKQALQQNQQIFKGK